MKLILHIGTEKTGTTSIQDYLHINRRKLQEYGYYFIRSAGLKNNRAIPSYCMKEDHYDDFFEERGIDSKEKKEKFKKEFLSNFQEEISSIPSSVHTVIISSEHFHSRTSSLEEIQNVFSFLSDYFSQIKIICYLREQSAMCESSYSTGVKGGASIKFSEFIKTCHPDNIYYNHYKMLSNWEKVFGLDTLCVSLFNQNEFLNMDLLDDFTSKIDIKLIGKLNKNVSYKNESITPTGQFIGRIINKACASNPEIDSGPGFRGVFVKKICQEFCGKGEQIPLENKKEIYNAFYESNEAVRKKFFPSKRVLFNSPLEEKKEEINITHEVEDFLVEILVAFYNLGLEKGASKEPPVGLERGASKEPSVSGGLLSSLVHSIRRLPDLIDRLRM